ncbi:MAG: alpha/beta hydrolase [Halioglobus sp.]
MSTEAEKELEIHHDLQGSGPPLVMIGGWPPGRLSWEPQLEAFTERYTCMTVDWPGRGGSPKVDWSYSTQDMARAVVKIMDSIGWDEAHIVSTAIGGGAAQWIAITEPERVRSLGLQSTWGRFDVFNQAQADEQRALLDLDIELWQKNMMLWAHSPSYHVETNGKYLGTSRGKQLMPGDKEVIYKLLDCSRRHDALDKVHLIKAPTLITVGGEDYITGFRFSRQFFERIPGAELHVFPGMGHGMRHEDPEKYTKLTLDWLANLNGEH